MHTHSRTRYLCLTVIFTLFSVSIAEAQIWGKLKDVVNNKVEEVVTKEVAKQVNQTPEKSKKDNISTPTIQNNNNASKATYETGTANSDIDIIGLKLGMTQDQVIAALKKHNKDVDITFNEFKVTPSARKQNAEIPDHLQAIDARIGDIRTSPNETIIIRFSGPPANNTVNEIVRSVIFAEDILTDTVVNALKEKYGAPTQKSGMLLFGGAANDSMCHMMAYIGHQDHYYKSGCSGMELIAMINTNQETLGGLKTVLIDHGEIKRQILATNNYRAQLREERRQEELKKASQKAAPIL